MNRFTELLDVDKVKKLIERHEGTDSIILIPHYSINITSHYSEDNDILEDWYEFEELIGASMEVSDYDDLIISFDNE